jgi:anthranilate phosphoribosyltransferase
MDTLSALTAKVCKGIDLTIEEAENAATYLADETADVGDKKDFLIALSEKGESVAEVAAFARVYRKLSLDTGLEQYAESAIDVVGTGGTGCQGYNISSVSAMIVAAAGTRVLKHGNRAITSKSGSADFLSQIGLPLTSEKGILQKTSEELNFCFFFAPAFHPAFKYVMPVRKLLAEEGKRSIFNILGPLINPAKPNKQLLGVFSNRWVKPLADALTELGMVRGLSVNSYGGDMRADELTTCGVNRVAGIGELSSIDTEWTAQDFGLKESSWDEIKGGTAEDNLKLLEEMMLGKGPQGLSDTICLNAGAAFWIANDVKDIRSGIAKARSVLCGGTLSAWLKRISECNL